MKNLLILIGLVLICSAVLILASCEGDEYQQENKPIDSTDDGTHAKDRSLDQSCTTSDLLITDCLDACSCCDDPTAATHDALDQCVFLCDGDLLKVNQVENITPMNLTEYKECVVGCFSICDKPNKEITCPQECAHYLVKL